jgi:hypothetical protein
MPAAGAGFSNMPAQAAGAEFPSFVIYFLKKNPENCYFLKLLANFDGKDLFYY